MQVFAASIEVGIDGWCTAWVPELLGCFTNEPTESAALHALPEEILAYLRWLQRRTEPVRVHRAVAVEVIERYEVPGPLQWGNYEVLHGFECAPVTRTEVRRALRWMGFTRADALKLISILPPSSLNWTRPRQKRTIGEQLQHVAHGEQWYLQRLALGPYPDSGEAVDYPVQYLARIRSTVVERLSRLTREERARVVQADNGRWWSTRKMVGRMLYHERYHIRSMARIASHNQVRVPEGLGGWSHY